MCVERLNAVTIRYRNVALVSDISYTILIMKKEESLTPIQMSGVIYSIFSCEITIKTLVSFSEIQFIADTNCMSIPPSKNING